MFRLTTDELDAAFRAIEHHGYSALIPKPKEWDVLSANWGKIRDGIASLDLDHYQPYAALRIYAPKSRYNLRVVTLLHPQDLLIYTALVLIAKNDIEAARVPVAEGRVFSYRVDVAHEDRLYISTGAHDDYFAALRTKATAFMGSVGLSDIADFYPRIYHHRLENVIASVASTPRVAEVGRVLCKRFLSHLARGDSYGIPVGPLASRVLGEAILIDVDEALLSEGIDFVRWVDDFNFFCATELAAQKALFYLAEWTFEHHGLTLQPLKTKVLQIGQYRDQVLVDRKKRLADKIEEGQAEHWQEVFRIMKEMNEYLEPDEVELTEEDIGAIDGLKLEEMLTEALAHAGGVDYEMASFILGQIGSHKGLPDENKQSLIAVVVANVELLFPVAQDVAKFLLSFDDLDANAKRDIGAALIGPLLASPKEVQEYYAMWILHVAGESPDWNDPVDLLKVYRESRSRVVRRFAALALSLSANRQQAIMVRDDFDSSAPLVRLAIQMCTRRLPADEKIHWKRKTVITGLLEKEI